MFKTRLISGAVLIAVLLGIIIAGGDILLAFLGIISIIGMTELYKCKDLHKSLPGYAGYILTAVYYVVLRFASENAALGVIMISLIIILGVYVFAFPKFNADQVFVVYFGILYVGVMLSYIYKTRMLSDGAYVVWLIILASWGCDTSAYLIGRKFGKHRLAPVLSPKKSVEGAVGGVLGGALAGFIYALCINILSSQPVWERLWIYPLICACGAVISQIGDLAASGIKRNHDVKDYGKLIPGHGGILDRFDSVIFVSPIIYYLALLLGL